MDVVYRRCAGLDVHQETVVACVLVSAGRRVHKQTRTFRTMTRDLAELSTWLAEQQVEQVALGSTGVFWWPVFNLLEEGGHAVMLVNPQHVKQVPGRKTDVRDSEWLAELLRHGLLKARFIPPVAIRELRELTRYRAAQMAQRSSEINRLHKVLESANLQLAVVATDVPGVSGQRMLRALAAGEELADLAKGKLRAKLAELERALEGRVKPHHRLLIGIILDHIRYSTSAVARLDEQLAVALHPFTTEIALLDSIAGIGPTAAAALLAEVGADRGAFGSDKQLASWAGLCPGNRQSGGRRLSGKTTKGNVGPRRILGQVAWAAVRERGSSFGARYRRLCRRQGEQKAIVAVMHNLLRVIYHVLRDRVPYRELGADYYQPCDPARTTRRLVKGLERLGYTVTLAPAVA